jgi:hypothetical protein
MFSKSTFLKLFLIILCFTLAGKVVMAQTQVEVIIKNDAQVSPNIYEFDVYLVSTGSTPFEMSLHQYGLNYNSAIKNGGTLTASWVSGTTEINPAQLQNTLNTLSNPSQIRIASPQPPGAGNGTQIPLSPGKRVGRLRMTNSVAFAAVSPNIAFSFTGSATSTRCGVSWYNGTTNTAFCSPAITTGCTGTSVYTNQMNNPVLNAPSCTAPTLSSSITNVTCSGGSDGAIDLTTSGGTPVPLTYSWSNGSTTEDLIGLSAGNYTVTVTTAGGGCSASATYTVGDGSGVVTTNNSTVTACESYTWSVNGQTYTQSGTYSSTSGCATEVLDLTIITQPAQPSIACYETATFNSTTCQWDVTGTQPAQPSLACYETATFNSTTCQWDVSGTQPVQPSIACYETATFNSTTCQWDVTGTQPAQPTGLACYQTVAFDTVACGWTISVSNQPCVDFDYPNFSDTTGTVQISTYGVQSNAIKLTNSGTTFDVGNVYRSNSVRYNRDFKFQWTFQISGGSGSFGGADGFCLQWATSNNTNGSGNASNLGMVASTSTANALKFLTYSSNRMEWRKSNTVQLNPHNQHAWSVPDGYLDQQVFYWLDYDHDSSRAHFYSSLINAKPARPQVVLNNFTFDTTAYFIGFGAGTGAASANHLLKAMKLEFAAVDEPQSEFFYPYFNNPINAGLTTVSTDGIDAGRLLLTNASLGNVGNVYRSTTATYNRDFLLEWEFECSGGNGYDGFCVQWTTENTATGSGGGGTSAIQQSSTKHVVRFNTPSASTTNPTWLTNNVNQNLTGSSPFSFRRRAGYWLEYDHDSSKAYLYFSEHPSRPATPQRVLNGFSFPDTAYYLGFGAATGGLTQNHYLRGLRLTYIPCWGISGSQPAQPSIACYQTATFNTTTCSWDVSGSQPAQPSLACYETATFNGTTCQWDVSGTQPAQPSIACYETALFNSTTCQWDVTGTQPAQPTGLASWQTATFNNTTCQWVVTGTPPGAPVGGTVVYDNSASSPMRNAVVVLKQGNAEVVRDTTDATGAFLLPLVAPGTYDVVVTSNTPWGGVNATDAIIIINHYSNRFQLSGIRLTAADVNGSQSFNATDALNIMQRFTGALQTFSVGNYAASTSSYTASGAGTGSLNVSMLCYGDVNASYQPNGGFVRTSWKDLSTQGVARITSGSYEVPLFVSRGVQPAGVSIELELPEGLRVLGVRASEGLRANQVVYHQEGNRVRMAWLDESGAELKAGDVLCYVQVEGAVEGVWRSSTEVELANVLGEVQSGVELRMPKLSASLGAMEASVYPNPGRGLRTLSLELSEGMGVAVRVTDALGRTVYTHTAGTLASGTHLMELNMEGWPVGSYQVQVLGATAEGKTHQRSITVLQTH